MDSSSFNNEADQVLVERFTRNSDEAIFRELYRRHTPVLYLLALRLLAGSEANAQEAVQETWIEPAGYYRSLNGDRVCAPG